MRSIIILVFTIFLSTLLYSAAPPDSLLAYYKAVRTSALYSPEGTGPQLTDSAAVKSVFGISYELRRQYTSFAENDRALIDVLLNRPELDSSIVTPRGNARIHFNVSGSDQPLYDVNEFAAAVDSVYSYIIDYLGYPPPADNGGPDNLYDFYIYDIGNLYGETVFEKEITAGSGLYYSFIRIDSDFINAYTHGINAAMVTAAHEFHHGIQVAHYGFRSSDLFYYEMSSTAMEEFVFDHVNDYVGYMSAYFQNPGVSFGSGDGYSQAVWNIYLAGRYDHSILKRQWELMPDNRALFAIKQSISEYGDSFEQVFSDFAAELYFTGYRAGYGTYLSEAANYPRVRIIANANINGSPVTLNAYPVSVNYIRYVHQHDFSSDTLIAVIVNTDLQKAIVSPSILSTCSYQIINSLSEGYTNLNDYYFRKFTADVPSLWTQTEILNNTPLDVSDDPIAEISGVVHPNPYLYSEHNGLPLTIPVKTDEAGKVDLKIISFSGREIFTNRVEFLSSGEKAVQWNALSIDGEKLPTGIYIYVLRFESGEIVKGKIAIVN